MRESGNQCVAEITREYLIVIQVFISLYFLRMYRYLAIRSLESSWSDYSITRTCSAIQKHKEPLKHAWTYQGKFVASRLI